VLLCSKASNASTSCSSITSKLLRLLTVVVEDDVGEVLPDDVDVELADDLEDSVEMLVVLLPLLILLTLVEV